MNDLEQFEEYHDEVVKFICGLFINRNERKNRPFFWHPTVAVENNVVGSVFSDVQAALVGTKLQTMGFATINWDHNANTDENNLDTPKMTSSALEAPSTTASMIKKENEHQIVPNSTVDTVNKSQNNIS